MERLEETDAIASTSASAATRRNKPRSATKRRSFSDIYDTPNETDSDSEFVPLKKNRKKLPTVKSEPRLSSKQRTLVNAHSPVGRRHGRASQVSPSRSKAKKNLYQEPEIRRSSRERKPKLKGSPSRSPKKSKASQGKHRQSSKSPVGTRHSTRSSSKQDKKLSYKGFVNSQ